jgi:F0F1-type ATP synthase membrane subunit a
MKRPSDVAAFVAIVIAFGGFAATGAFKSDLATLVGQAMADKVGAVIDIVSGVAGVLSLALRLQSNPSPPPGQQHVTEAVPPKGSAT